MTTQTFQMTTALTVFYALLDSWQLDDTQNGVHDAFATANSGKMLTVTSTGGPIPLSQTLNPTNANYMHWYDAGVMTACGVATETYQARSNELYYILIGNLPGCKADSAGQLLPTDFTDWRPVTINQPAPGGATTEFYDLATLRAASATVPMVLNRPYVGYFTTPAFFANWQTNASNTMRVTINQALIVGLGAHIDGTDPTVPTSTPGLDTAHASSPDCVSCHQLMDPTRSILRGDVLLELRRAERSDLHEPAGPLHLLERAEPVSSSTSSAASSPRIRSWPPAGRRSFATTSTPSRARRGSGVPEHRRAVHELELLVERAREGSGHLADHDAHDGHAHDHDGWRNGRSLAPRSSVRGVTRASASPTSAASTSRRRRCCRTSGSRSSGACLPTATDAAAIAPVLPNNPSLFYRAGTENLCEALAALVIDNAKTPAGAKTLVEHAACGRDRRLRDRGRARALGPAREHGEHAAHRALHRGPAQGTATAALQSTFVAACMAPTAISIGM